MKLTIDKNVLSNAVQTASRFVNPKNPIPVLQGVLFEAEGSTLRLSATNLEIGIRKSVEAEVQETGRVVVPAKQFAELVKKLPDGNLTILTNPDITQITIQYGLFSEFTMMVMNAEEYPLLPVPETEDKIKLPSGVFKEMIRQVIIAVDDDDSPRPVFRGALLSNEDEYLTLAGTDTHRLAVSKYRLPIMAKVPADTIIPRYTLIELGRALDNEKEQENLAVIASQNQIAFTFGETAIISRLIEGKYPNFRSVVPNKYSTLVKVKREPLLESLERAQLLAKSASEVIPTKLWIRDGKVKVTVQTQEGKLAEELDVAFEGEPLIIGFNSDLLVEGLKTIDSEEVLLKLNGSFGPAVLQPMNSDDQLYLVLPIRMPSEAFNEAA
ncbi:MAG: DNA polymerase III subunit beta [Syntrophothermus sp.]|uniref:DNA polymerase III subunit beta n=1 Tax=Syntrophothermus sp. TaxID=2736299 RepID=UPI00257A03CB|nr:DNA polymerase III subunit beta [Syntrophothermus sp.]NSW83927.1 DNA polymerase III subunit beta [Syntrophothermus sp.]